MILSAVPTTSAHAERLHLKTVLKSPEILPVHKMEWHKSEQQSYLFCMKPLLCKLYTIGNDFTEILPVHKMEWHKSEQQS